MTVAVSTPDGLGCAARIFAMGLAIVGMFSFAIRGAWVLVSEISN
jgi:hypothetical protein